MRSEAALQDRKHFLISLSCRSGRRGRLVSLNSGHSCGSKWFSKFEISPGAIPKGNQMEQEEEEQEEKEQEEKEQEEDKQEEKEREEKEQEEQEEKEQEEEVE